MSGLVNLGKVIIQKFGLGNKLKDYIDRYIKLTEEMCDEKKNQADWYQLFRERAKTEITLLQEIRRLL